MLKDRIKCFLFGHIPYRYSWTNFYSFHSRKGRRKRSHITIWKHKHYREYCIRCGKLLRRK